MQTSPQGVATLSGLPLGRYTIVAEFSGPGELLIQTRNLAAFAALLKPFFPTQTGGGGFNLNLGG